MSFELLFMTQRPIIFPTPFLIAQKRFLTGKESSEQETDKKKESYN